MRRLIDEDGMNDGHKRAHLRIVVRRSKEDLQNHEQAQAPLSQTGIPFVGQER